MKSTSHKQDRKSSRAAERTVTRIAKRSLLELSQRFGQLLTDLANTHIEPVETTHQLRVTSRRADVALQLFREWLPRDRRQWMRRVLKFVRADAGAVRDLDLLEQQWRLADGAMAAQVPPDAATWMHKRIQTQRAQARHRLFHWTRKSAASRFRKRSQRLVRRVRPRHSGSPHVWISQSLVKLVGGLKDSLPMVSTSLANSHRARIHARRLRYAIELLSQVLPAETVSVAATLAQIQEQLGLVNDDATANRHLRASIEACGHPKLVPQLQSLLDRSEAAATARLEKWNADMSEQIAVLAELLARLASKPGQLLIK